MGESFEAKLIEASEKAVFKKAKQIVRAGGVLCCHEASPGVLRAICRDSKGVVYHSELRGFPNGPFSGTCNCKSEYRGFCPHSMAAALYHAKYTIKQHDEAEQPDAPAHWFSGMVNPGIPILMNELIAPSKAFLEIEAVKNLPHGVTNWEKIGLCFSVNVDGQKSIRSSSTLSASEANLGVQDKQIVHYLSSLKAQDGQNNIFTPEECSGLFHCMVGHRHFTFGGKNIFIRRDPAVLALLIEKKAGKTIFHPGILVKDTPLAVKDPCLIVGTNGCWVGVEREYWWISGIDVTLIRNFLHADPYVCKNTAEVDVVMRMREQLPFQILPYKLAKIGEDVAFRTLYVGRLNEANVLEMEVFFEYGNTLCSADNARLVSDGGRTIRRNTRGEGAVIRELRNFGFRKVTGNSQDVDRNKLALSEKEVIGKFIDEVIPGWFRERRQCLLSSELAALAGNAGNTSVSVRVVETTEDDFTLAVSFTAGGVPIRWRDLQNAASKNEFFMTVSSVPGLLVKIPPELRKIASALQLMTTLQKDREDSPDCDILKVSRFAALYWAKIGGNVPGLVPYEFLRLNAELEDAKNFVTSDVVFENSAFEGKLRPYQETGVYWLKSLSSRGYNLILADEMGLGKTIQAISMLALEPLKTLPACVIAPTSLVDNWKREFAKFAPTLRTVAISGGDRDALWKQTTTADVCICSYALAKRDAAELLKHSFKYLFLDEAQHIKNPESQNAHVCKSISAKHRIVLTGTPLENSIEDLWSIFDFLHPGILGTLHAFRARYANMDDGNELRLELARFIAPFILRRKKDAVCTDLPPKQEQDLFCNMEEGQAKLYRQYEKAAREQCAELKLNAASSLKRMNFLTTLLRMRQICCCPELLPEKGGNSPVDSAKFELLQELVQESIDSDHKILVFSQFVGMLKIIRGWLEKQGISYEYLDGSTTNRMEHIDAFNNNPGVKVFLLSLKAGGVGLNLTAADTVILYDPWWNPAVEAQAMDRTHRIGQTKRVTCYKLFVRDTIEERVRLLQEKKQELFSALVDENAQEIAKMSIEDFEFLLDITAAV